MLKKSMGASMPSNEQEHDVENCLLYYYHAIFSQSAFSSKYGFKKLVLCAQINQHQKKEAGNFSIKLYQLLFLVWKYLKKV